MSLSLIALPVLTAIRLVAPTPADALPNSLAFWDAHRGVIGGGVRICRQPCRGTIAVTIDGGRTSRIVLRTRGPVSWVTTSGRADGWALVERCNATGCKRSELWQTRDAGRSWQLMRRQPPLNPSFATARLGMAVAGHYTGVAPTGIVLTTDGGRSWRAVRSPCPPSPHGWSLSAAVSFPAPRRAWALCAGQGATGYEDKAVYLSTDVGRSWHVVAQSFALRGGRSRGGISSYGYAQGVAFATNGSGLLWESRGTLYTTVDGGRNWSGLPDVVQPELDFGQSACQLATGHAFAIVARSTGHDARIITTAGRGRAWRTVRRYLVGA